MRLFDVLFFSVIYFLLHVDMIIMIKARLFISIETKNKRRDSIGALRVSFLIKENKKK